MNRKGVTLHLQHLAGEGSKGLSLEQTLHYMRRNLPFKEFDRCISAVSDYLLQALREKDGHK